MRRNEILTATALVLLGGAVALSAQAPASQRKAPNEPPTIRTTVAEKDLASVTQKDVLIATAGKGKYLYAYVPEEESILKFSETGAQWDDPIQLTYFEHPKLPTFSRMTIGDGRVAFSGSESIFVFDLNGALIAFGRIFRPSDIAMISEDTWVVGLCNLPHPAVRGMFLARKAFGPEVPRVVIYDEEFEVQRKGLIEGEVPGSPNAGIARQLRLAVAGDRIYAAEVGSYRIFELSKKLQLRTTLEDKDLFFAEDESGVETSNEDLIADPPLDTIGRDLAVPEQPERKARQGGSAAIDVSRVVADIAWADDSGGLFVLLEKAGVGGDLHGVDRVDTFTGEVIRSHIALPLEYRDFKLKQLAVGRRYVWMRGYRVDTPIFRVDRLALDQGKLLKIPVAAHGDPVEETADGTKAVRP